MSRTHMVVPAAPARAGAAPPHQRPTWVEVDLGAIAANVAALKAQAAAPLLMAVVKANGYGHGIVPAARGALAGGADWLAVALVEEGVALRAAGITAPILVMAEPPPEAIPALLAGDLTPAVYSAPVIDAVDLAGRQRGLPVPVHCKLDTGMRRVGVPQADWDDTFKRLRGAAGITVEGIWSHFAVADEPGHEFIAHQAREFRRGLALAASLGVEPPLTHLCNSAGTLHLHDEHHGMVRPGLAVYGLEPAPGIAAGVGLRPALSWWSRLSLVKRVAAGEAVSYGLRWRAPHDVTVGTVPVGYADGVVRALSDKASVVWRGTAAPMRGTICMDQLLVEVGEDAAAGDEVQLLGSRAQADSASVARAQADSASVSVTADDWARWLGTINYEVVCGISARVPRLYRELDGSWTGG